MEGRKENPIAENRGLCCKTPMSWFDPYYSDFPVKRELVYYVAEILEKRGEDNSVFGRAVWGEHGGKAWRAVRNVEAPVTKSGDYKKPRRISLEDAYKMATVLNRNLSDLISEAVIRYENKAKKGIIPRKPSPSSEPTDPAQSA